MEILRRKIKRDKTFLNIDDYFEEELKRKPLFFNKSFFKKFVKKHGKQLSKSIIKVMFFAIGKKFNNRFFDEDIQIPSEFSGPRQTSKGKYNNGSYLDSYGKMHYPNGRA